jgi:hypothetical protein
MRVAFSAAVAVLLSGCVSTPSTNFVTSASGPAATSDPIVLNTAPAPGSAPPLPATAAGGPTSAIAGSESTVAPAAAATLDATPPAPTSPVAGAPAAPAEETVTSSFPNINTVPQQPEGKLLSPEERAKMIAELEALRKRQHGPAAAAAPALPAKCLDKNVAKTDPDCKPATD